MSKTYTQCLCNLDLWENKIGQMMPGCLDVHLTKGTIINIKDPTNIDLKIFLCEAQTPLYPRSTSNRLTSTLMLLVCCTIFAIPNNFVDELLKLLKEMSLPKDNTLPKSFSKAKCLLMRSGLSYNSIHACRDGCLGKNWWMQHSAQNAINRSM
jgi:hypothetical protein